MDNGTSKQQPETLADVHEAYLEDLAPKARKVMNDERLASFRSLAVRRVLAMLLVIFSLIYMYSDFINTWEVIWFTDIAFFCLFAMLVFLADRTARGFFTFPTKLLDDRIISRRNESYRHATQLMSVIMVLHIIFTILVMTFSSVNPVKLMDPFIALIGMWLLVSLLPLSVFLWREPEL